MRKKPSIDEFMRGGAVDKIARSEREGKEQREQKVFRLPVSIITALRDKAFSASAEEKRRVTETEVLEDALRKHLKL